MRLRRPSRRASSAQARALSAYWDEVARRAPADPVPPADLDRDLAATVRHLSAIPDNAAPDPRFAAQLLARIVAVSQERTTMSTTSAVSLSPASVRPTNQWPAPAGRPPLAPAPAARWWPVMAITAIAAVVVAALWVTSLGGDAPRDRRDTTAIVAAGSPAATREPNGNGTPAPANQTIGTGDVTLYYTAVVDLSGPGDTAELWLIDVEPGRFLWSPGASSPLVMPLTGTLRNQRSAMTLEGGQSVWLPSATDWRFENTTESTIQVLALSFGDGDRPVPNVVVGPQQQGFAAVNLGPITFDRAYGAALLEVAPATGPEGATMIDTGSDGFAVIMAERSPTIVDLFGGEGSLRRFSLDAGLQRPEDGLRIAPDSTGQTAVYLAEGDVLTITGGAAAHIRGEGAQAIPALVLTIRYDSARLQSIQSGTVLVPSPDLSDSPVAATGCDVEPYTDVELRSLLATPPADVLPSIRFGLTDGESADAETASEIETSAELLAACARTGDVLRYARLWSADGLRYVYSAADLEDDLRDANQSQIFTPDPPTVDATVQDVRIHPDGRVSAVVDLGGEVAYVVWVKQNGVYLVELFNNAIFSGPLADGSRCDSPPLDAAELEAVVPATLTPASSPSGQGLDIYPLLPEGTTPGPIPPDTVGLDVATEAVTRIVDCLSTLDPARIVPLATDDFRAQWAGVYPTLVPLHEPQSTAETRLPISVPTIVRVDVDETSSERRVGVQLSGAITAYIVFMEVDGEWLIDGWAPL